MQNQIIKLSKLHINTGQIEGVPKNPRFIRDERFKRLVKSIQDDPEMLALRELIAFDNGGKLVVIGGNMRLRAMQELGFKETHVKILPSDTPVEKLRAYVIKDNVNFGDHDFDALANDWETEELADFGLDIPDFEPEGTDEAGAPGNFNDEGIEGKSQYGVIVICDSEGVQESVFRDLTNMGFNCKVVVT